MLGTGERSGSTLLHGGQGHNIDTGLRGARPRVILLVRKVVHFALLGCANSALVYQALLENKGTYGKSLRPNTPIFELTLSAIPGLLLPFTFHETIISGRVPGSGEIHCRERPGQALAID